MLIITTLRVLTQHTHTRIHTHTYIHMHTYVCFQPGITWVSQAVLVIKNLPANAGDVRETSSIPWSERSPGGGHGNLLQYSFLGNPHQGEELGGLHSIDLRRFVHD